MIYECPMCRANTVDFEGKVCDECKKDDRWIEEDNLLPNPRTGKVERDYRDYRHNWDHPEEDYYGSNPGDW